MTDIYQIQLKEHLDNWWADRFADFNVSYTEAGTTLLTGPLPDQAALHGLLIRVRDLGLTILSLARVESGQGGFPSEG
jgi:hypothetical protein